MQWLEPCRTLLQQSTFQINSLTITMLHQKFEYHPCNHLYLLSSINTILHHSFFQLVRKIRKEAVLISNDCIGPEALLWVKYYNYIEDVPSGCKLEKLFYLEYKRGFITLVGVSILKYKFTRKKYSLLIIHRQLLEKQLA